MSVLVAVLRELAGLFVDDGALALAIIGIVVLASIAATAMPEVPMAGAILLLGCLGALFVNVMQAARR